MAAINPHQNEVYFASFDQCIAVGVVDRWYISNLQACCILEIRRHMIHATCHLCLGFPGGFSDLEINCIRLQAGVPLSTALCTGGHQQQGAGKQ